MCFSSDLVFSTRVSGVVFWPHLGTVNAKFKDLPGVPLPGPAGGLTTPPDPQLHKAMTFGHCLSCLSHDKTQLKIPL